MEIQKVHLSVIVIPFTQNMSEIMKKIVMICLLVSLTTPANAWWDSYGGFTCGYMDPLTSFLDDIFGPPCPPPPMVAVPMQPVPMAPPPPPAVSPPGMPCRGAPVYGPFGMGYGRSCIY